jgi:zinc/manganese transport system substrate-binding protein
VVAGENFWGSIAAQLGGSHVSVTSLVQSPTGDPHEYESTTDDARLIAQARYVILNGAGYDDWGQKVLDANPVEGRTVTVIANEVGVKTGENPHLWYHPDFVEKAADRITRDLKTLDAANASYYDQQRSAFETSLKPYRDLIATIKATYAGKKIGISESIFAYLADALGLTIATPKDYYNAEAEGTEPSAAAIATFNEQIEKHDIQVFVLNIQTIDNTVKNVQEQVAKAKIPTIEISETVRPVGGTFQDWMVKQLTDLKNALAKNGAA